MEEEICKAILAAIHADAPLVALLAKLEDETTPSAFYSSGDPPVDLSFPSIRVWMVTDNENKDIPGDYKPQVQIDVFVVLDSEVSGIVNRLRAMFTIPQRAAAMTTTTHRLRTMRKTGQVRLSAPFQTTDEQSLTHVATAWTLKVTEIES